MRPLSLSRTLMLTACCAGLATTACRVPLEDTGNAAPSAPVVQILPDQATTLDELSVSFLTESTDADRDDVEYQYRWLRDGNDAGWSEPTVPADQTTRDEVWSVEVTATDGADLSEPATAERAIDNTGPTVGSALLTPDDATVEDALLCTALEVVDVDEDELTSTYSWTVDGVPQADTEETFSASGLSRGQSVSCTVTTADDALESEPVTSNAVVVQNSVPTAPAIALQPEAPRTGDTLTATILEDGVDADGDAISYTYSWTVDGKDAGVTGASVSSEMTTRGQIWTVSVYGSDGLDDSPVATAETYIENTLPQVTTVGLSPATPLISDVLTCSALTVEEPDGDKLTYRYLWNVAGGFISHSEATLSAPDFAKGDSVACSIFANDGYGDSDIASSEPVVIGNTPPIGLTATAGPADPTEADLVVCDATASDADEDELSFQYVWRVNGSSIPKAILSSLSGESFDKGDTIDCIATPVDDTEAGSPVTSNTVVAINTPPTLDTPGIGPSPAYSGDLIFCDAPEPEDVDPADAGLLGVRYAWIVNGAELAGETDSTFDSAGYPHDTTFACVAYPTDPESEGMPAESAVLVLDNTPPSVTSITIEPDPAYESSELLCQIEVEDLDEDEVTVEFGWLVDGRTAGEMTDRLTGDAFDKNQTVECTAVASDPDSTGELATSEPLVILNTPPSIGEVYISPDEAYTDSSFSCLYEGFEDDDWDANESTYEWFVDGESAGTEIVLGVEVGVGAEISCRVTPFDGTEEGTPVDSETVTVVNRVPEINLVSIAPLEAYTDTLIESTVDISDADLHELTITYDWYVDDLLLGSATGPTLDGAVSFNRGDEVYLIVTVADPYDTAEPVRSETITILNSAPTADSIALSTDEATEATEITCSAMSSDLDGDSVEIAYSWKIDGAALDFDGETLTGAYFNKDQEVQCVATPSDDADTGAPIYSEVLVIENTPPVQSVPTVGPDPAYSGDILTCTAAIPTDIDPADLDALSQDYEWTINGEASSREDEPQIDTSGYIRGDTFACTVTPIDDDTSGEPVTSATLELSNTPPTVDDVPVVTPDDPTTETTLTCDTSGTSDVDGDDVTLGYRWWVEGEEVPVTTENLSPEWTHRGDRVLCEATPSDGIDHGAPVISAEVEILNTAPSAPEIRIEPTPAYTEDLLLVTFVEEATDVDDDDLFYRYSWTLNGEDAFISGSSVSASNTRRGDVWSVTVTATDGDLDSPSSTTSIEIQNSAPQITSVTLTPEDAYESTSLLCSATAEDDDGDAITFAYEWTVNGVDARESGSTLDGADFDKHDVVACIVTPEDDRDEGEAVTSEAITILNTVPSVANVTISPDPAYGTDSLTCSWSGFDDDDNDDDSSRNRWFVNGVEFGLTPLLATGFGRDDTVTCEVTPNDGEADGAPMMSEPLIIQNSAPSAPVLMLTPDPALTVDAISVVILEDATDDDGDAVTYSYSWTVNGADAFIYGSTVAPSNTQRDEVWTVTVIATDGELEGPPVTASVEVQNSAPRVTSLTLTPVDAYTSSSLLCTAATEDDDGDAIDLDYDWTVNGDNPRESSDTLDSDEFDKGDTVTCSVTPDDDTDEGETATSNAVTILNTPPSVASVTITPDPAYGTDILTCSWSGFDDDDNDDDNSRNRWFVNGVEYGLSPVLATGFGRDDVVTCEVTPNDGEDDGAPMMSEPLTIQNTAPTAPTVMITPDPAQTEDALLAVILDEATDADGDEVSYNYSWTVDGDETGLTGSSLSDSFTRRGDVWTVTVTPTDGDLSGEPATASVDITNTVPEVYLVTLTPNPATAGDVLSCDPFSVYDADGDDVSFDYDWVVNGVTVSGSSSTLEAPSFQRGDEVVCQVTPSDDEGSGEALESAGVMIVNSPPQLVSVTVTPEDPYVGTDLTCVAEVEDLDGDDVSLTYTWSVNGGSVSVAGPTLFATMLEGGDEVECTVTAYDATEAGDTLTSDPTTVLNLDVAIEYAFDEGAGQTLFDLSGNAYDATLGSTGGLDSEDPIWGDGYLSFWGEPFDGVGPRPGSCASTRIDGGALDAMTLVAAFRGDPQDTQIRMLRLYGADSFLSFDPWGEGFIIEQGSEFVATLGGLDSDWHLLTLTWDSDGTAVVYLDGELHAVGDLDAPSEMGPIEELFLGGAGCGDDPFNGDLSYFLLSDRVLDDSERESLETRIADELADRGVVIEGLAEAPVSAGPLGSTAELAGHDCLDILESGDSSGDGTYWIDPDATGAFEVYCDMTTDGGGWTLVFVAETDNYSSTELDYTVDVSGLVADESDMLTVHRDASMELIDGWASFPMPFEWGTMSPLAFETGETWLDDVLLNGSSEGSRLLYHGYADWTSNCGLGAWDTAQLRGQFCIGEVVDSPAYVNFGRDELDGCAHNGGDGHLYTPACSDDRRFTLGIRRRVELDSGSGGSDAEGALGSAAELAGLDCLDILESGDATGDGTYWIDPFSEGAFEVYCDMTTEGGGWQLISTFQDVDGSITDDDNYFPFEPGRYVTLDPVTTVTDEHGHVDTRQEFDEVMVSKPNPDDWRLRLVKTEGVWNSDWREHLAGELLPTGWGVASEYYYPTTGLMEGFAKGPDDDEEVGLGIAPADTVFQSWPNTTNQYSTGHRMAFQVNNGSWDGVGSYYGVCCMYHGLQEPEGYYEEYYGALSIWHRRTP